MIPQLLKSFCDTKEVYYRRELCQNNEKSERLNWLENNLTSLGIKYELDEFTKRECNFTNVILKGSSNLFFTAHYDIIDIESDNANDNSASVINLITLKKIAPFVNVILFDGEEPPFLGVGSEHFITTSLYKNPEYILNLELTGVGKNILISNYSNDYLIHDIMVYDYNAFEYRFPINDAVIMKKHKPQLGIETVVLANINNNIPNVSHFSNLHSNRDSLSTINYSDMEHFVYNVLKSLAEK